MAKEELYAIRTKGEPIAVRIKEMFFKNQPWSPTVAWAVGIKLGDLKRIARKGYPGMDEIKFLHELSGYSEQDIYDAFDMEAKEGTCKVNQHVNSGTPMALSTAMKSLKL